MNFLYLANALGVKGIQSGVEYRSRCPLHSDNNPSFSLNLEKGVWTCFSSCGSGDFYRLVELVLNCSPQEARGWIHHNGQATSIEQITASLGQKLNLVQPIIDVKYPSDGWKAYYAALDAGRMPQWFINRGFTWDTIKHWGIKYDLVNDAVVIPVIWQGELVGTVTRNNRTEPKYQNSKNLPVANILFGEISASQSVIILVEGVLDALWLWQLGYNAGGLLGKQFGPGHIRTLKENRYGEIILGLDNDEAGRKATKEVIDKLTHNGYLLPQIKVLKFPGKNKDDTGYRKDAQDCTSEEFKEIYGNRKDYILG